MDERGVIMGEIYCIDGENNRTEDRDGDGGYTSTEACRSPFSGLLVSG